MNADYPGTTHVVPADPSNYYTPAGHGGVPNRPRALFLHTPEEDADDNEVTPRYFSRPIWVTVNGQQVQRFASTHYYADSDGDWYQMVPELCMAIANGQDGKPLPSWADPSTSLNWQSLSVEIEGRAHTIHLTCPRGGPQWNAIVRWVADRCRKHAIPLDRQRVMGHYEVSTWRTDPGRLDIDQIVRDAQALGAPQVQEDFMKETEWVTAGVYGQDKTYVVGVCASKPFMRRFHVDSAKTEDALRAAKLITRLTPVKITQAQLDRYAEG